MAGASLVRNETKKAMQKALLFRRRNGIIILRSEVVSWIYRYCLYSAGKYFYTEGGKLSDDLFFYFFICDDSLYLIFQVERYCAMPGKLI